MRKWRSGEVESEVEKIVSERVGRLTGKQMRKMDRRGNEDGGGEVSTRGGTLQGRCDIA